MSTLAERIRIALDAAKMSQVELANRCGVQPPSVNGWLGGKAKFLRGENLLRAARALHVNQEWLATGLGPMQGVGEIGESAEEIELLSIFRAVPVTERDFILGVARHIRDGIDARTATPRKQQ